jgi:uncharacterized protein involved in exopolysaccharide biosynthesis
LALDTKTSSDFLRLPEDPYREAKVYPLLELLWDNRKQLFLWLLAGIAVAVLLRFVLPANYESTARVLPSDTTSEAAAMMMSGGMGNAGTNLGAVSDLLGMKTPGAFCAALLRSDTVLDGIVSRLDLRKVYKVRDDETLRRALSSRTVVVDDKKSGIVTLTVTDHDPNRAAAIANAYTDELDKALQTLNTSAAHREREFLEQRIEEARQKLSAAETALAQFSSKNSTLDIKEQGKAAFEVASKVEGELIVAQSELQGLRQIYGPDHPRVKAAEARLAQLRAAGGKLGSPGGDGDKELQFLSISRLPMVGVTYADLYREVKVQEVIYEGLLRQYEISKVEEVKETPRLRVIDKGKVPARRTSPRLYVLLIFCTLMSLAIAVLTIVSRKHWEQADPEEPWKHLALRIIGDLQDTFNGIRRRAGALT